MALDRPHQTTWREGSFLIATKLESARALVHAAGPATEREDDRSVREGLARARTALRSTVSEVNHFRVAHPLSPETDYVEASGAALALKSACAATMALEVLLDAGAALLATHDVEDTDVLIGACIDAEQSFEVSAAVIEAAPRSHGTAMVNLEHAFDADGEVDLRRRVTLALSAIGDINRRARAAVATLA